MILTVDTSTLSSKSQDTTVNYAPALTFTEQQEICLLSCNLWYSWCNISTAFNNNEVAYYNGDVWIIITMMNGLYNIDQISTYIKNVMTGAGDDPANINLVGNYSTLRCDLFLLNGYRLDLSRGNFHKILGFDSGIYTTTITSQTNVNITYDITSINFHNSVVDTSYSYANSFNDDIIYGGYSPTSSPGSLLSINPPNLIYLPLNSNSIANMRLRITDQSGNLLDLNGESVSYTFHIRSMK